MRLYSACARSISRYIGIAAKAHLKVVGDRLAQSFQDNVGGT